MHYVHRDKNGVMKAKYSYRTGGAILDNCPVSLRPGRWQVADDYVFTVAGEIRIFLWEGDTLKIQEGPLR